MKILALFGSPKLKGNTNKILEMITDEFKDEKEYKRINLSKLKINHCMGCNKCNVGNFECIYKDDMDYVNKSIEEADLVILATPIHFNSMTSIMKVMVDRCQRLYNMKVNNNIVFKEKKGIIIATAGSSNSESFAALENISKYFFLSINGKVERKLFINSMDNKEINENDLKNIENMKNLLYTLYKDN
ncbi:flavodoxin family protein [Clostridiaceae bacterium HSG29]|nr:flavodoxin family protein [Clostridiaceae bacterium HSG29]